VFTSQPPKTGAKTEKKFLWGLKVQNLSFVRGSIIDALTKSRGVYQDRRSGKHVDLVQIQGGLRVKRWPPPGERIKRGMSPSL